MCISFSWFPLGFKYMHFLVLEILNISSLNSFSEGLYSWLILVGSSDLSSSLTKYGGVLRCFPILNFAVEMLQRVVVCLSDWKKCVLWSKVEWLHSSDVDLGAKMVLLSHREDSASILSASGFW